MHNLGIKGFAIVIQYETLSAVLLRSGRNYVEHRGRFSKLVKPPEGGNPRISPVRFLQYFRKHPNDSNILFTLILHPVFHLFNTIPQCQQPRSKK
jgi:hypothetical protein